MRRKVKSFTLSELIVVMIITAIVVGIAFSVLRLVQKQISIVRNNLEQTTDLLLFEERLWQDFNTYNNAAFNGNKLTLMSDLDTIDYNFDGEQVVRGLTDTLHKPLKIEGIYYKGNKVTAGSIDALKLSVVNAKNDYYIFVYSQKDATYEMNGHGF